MSRGASRLASIDIRDYRNLARVELELPDSGLALIGDNGQGKTNFLEAIYYFQLLRCARGTRDADAVRFGADAFSLRGEVRGPVEATVAIGFDRASKKKRIRVDGVPTQRLSDALGMLPAVMVSPADAVLAGGEPSARRRYLDVLLALTSRAYLSALQAYRTSLQHRNAAIRDIVRGGRANEESVAVWEAPLAEHGGVLVRERRAWVDESAARYRELCAAIGEQGATSLRYESAVAAGSDPAASLRELLASRRASDVRRGATHTGPHRDTLSLTLEGRELRGVGSAGQQRTSAVALRLLEAETYHRRSGSAPVFLMDDPFAELDAKRGAAIMEVLRHAAVGQTFLAVPKPSDIPEGFLELRRASVSAGRIEMGSA
ncbi:MAG TPA: DNA replication and repair protein RecF [Gemmatimonadaceae bacterium]|nr:DNA replication and repair protein RecF [Gemmatimonadaceae bacterium]